MSECKRGASAFGGLNMQLTLHFAVVNEQEIGHTGCMIEVQVLTTSKEK